MKISIAYLVSYDYQYLMSSLQRVYDYADEIILSVDRERLTWSGNTFHIPDEFFRQIEEIDTKKKIKLYQDSFYIKNLTPIEADRRQRNLTALQQKGHWKMQIDADEYPYQIEKLIDYLYALSWATLAPIITPMGLRGKLITLFKISGNEYYYINNNEIFSFATNQKTFGKNARYNADIPNFLTDFIFVHQSWARSEDEIRKKISNWGHRDDFDTEEYFKFWKSISRENYKEFKNFHPNMPHLWNKMEMIEAGSLEDFINKVESLHPQSLSAPVGKKEYFTALRKKLNLGKHFKNNKKA